MKHDKNDEWLDPLLSRYVHRESAKFDFHKWTKEHPNEARLLRSGYADYRPNAKTKIQNLWRFIMESKVTRYSAAAVIILAMTLVLFGPFWSPGNGNVVLAEVQQNVAGIETMIIRGTKTVTRPDELDNIIEFDGMKCEFDLVKYFSQQYGLVEEGYIGDKMFYRFTFNRLKRQTLLLLPLYKKYGIFASTDKQMRLLENGTPKGIINLLMEGGYQKLGRDNINGVETEVFEFQDPETFREIVPKTIFDIQGVKGKVWISIEEQLPVRVEGDVGIGKSFMSLFQELNLHEVNTFHDYNIELDEDIFDINPPEGYTELTLSDILQVIPAEAKAGAVAMGIIPVGLIFWRRRKRKKAANNQG
ncbi:MAG TPA: hypothetical protein DIU00_08410 [Phycisphaerales bacterium]|nr:hypothetical protein [Phycisphaerales bacterium]